MQRKKTHIHLKKNKTSSRKDYDAVVELLLENDPTHQTIFFPDKSMALPLHTACRYQASAAVIDLLLQNHEPRKQLLFPGPYQQLPLHIACRCQHADAVPVLIQYDTTQALIPDHTGRLPLHLAYLKQMPVDSIRCLLEAMIVGRSEQRGLVLWKQDLQKMIYYLQLEERDYMTSYKLEVTRNALLAFREQSVCLELVLWKRAYYYLAGGGDREVARIKSGAHEILPHVLSFLEGDPAEEILEQINK